MKKTDLGKYDLKQVLRNPGLIHQIQDNLCAMKGDGLLTSSLREGARTNIREAIKTIVDQYPVNPSYIKNVVGEDTLKLIEEFLGITLANDIKPINI